MGIDKDNTRPPVNLGRRTTKVNIWMVVLIIAFFVIGAVVLWALVIHPGSSTSDAVPLP